MKMVLVRSTAERSLCDQPLEENDAMKRTRVHAQRKFAQGAALSPVGIKKDILKFNRASPASDASPAKQSRNHSEISEVLPSKRPNTEDFLTFLCFRNTSILPARLDFFGAASVSGSGKNSGSNKKANSEGAAMGLANVAPQKSEEPKKCQDKSVTSKISVLKQRELARKKKLANLKHAQRANAKHLKPAVDRRKQLKTNLGTERSLRKNMKLKKLEAIKKKVPSTGKDTAGKKAPSTNNKTEKEVKRPVPVKSQAKDLKPSLVKSSIKSKAKRTPLGVRRNLRSGGSSLGGSQELILKSKRLQVIRNRKAKLGAGKQTTPPKGQTKSAKRVSLPKGKTTGLDFSSEDDQPLVKKQRTKENIEKPSSLPKIVEPQTSSRLSRKTKQTSSLPMKTQEKDTRGAKKPSADLESSKKKSQVDEAAAKTKENQEKNKKGKPEVMTETKEEITKKNQAKPESSPHEKPIKVKPKQAVIVKKNSVIANRTSKGKLLQAKTRSHGRLALRASSQSKKAKTTLTRSLRSEKELKKSKLENVSSTSETKAPNLVSTRSGKLQSQQNNPQKQTVDKVTKVKEWTNSGDRSDSVKLSISADNVSKSSKDETTEKAKQVVKKERPVIEKAKDSIQGPAKLSEKSNPVVHNTRRNSVPSVSPPPQVHKNKSKPINIPPEGASASAVRSSANISDEKKEPVKKSQVKTNQTLIKEKPEPAKKTKTVAKVPTPKSSNDLHDHPSSGKAGKKKLSKSENSKESTQKDQNSFAVSLRSGEKKPSVSSDEEIFSKLSALKNVNKKSSEESKETESKSAVEFLLKPSKVLNTTASKAGKSKDSQDLSESETEEPEASKVKTNNKNKPKSSVKTGPKKSNTAPDTSSSEDDKMEDLLNLAALKTNLNKKSNLSAKDKAKNTNVSKASNLSASNEGKNINLSKKSNFANKDAEKEINSVKTSNLSGGEEAKNINLNKKLNLSVNNKETNIDRSKKSNVTANDKETRQNKNDTKVLLNSPGNIDEESISSTSLPIVKENSGKSSKPDKIDSHKNLAAYSILCEKNVPKVSNLLKPLPESFNTTLIDSKNQNCSSPTVKRNQIKSSKSVSDASKIEKLPKEENFTDEDSLKLEEVKGRKAVVESTEKAAISERKKKNQTGVTKKVNNKVEDDDLNTAETNMLFTKTQDKDLHSESKLEKASNAIVSKEINSISKERGRKSNLIPSKDKNIPENSSPIQSAKKSNKEIHQAKSSNLVPQVESSVKAKELSRDSKVPLSKETNPPQPSVSLVPKSYISNFTEASNSEMKESKKTSFKGNLPQVKDVNHSNSLNEMKSKKKVMQVQDVEQLEVLEEASSSKNISQVKDSNLAKISTKTTPKRNLSVTEDVNVSKESKKKMSDESSTQSNDLKRLKDCNKISPKETVSKMKDMSPEPNKVATKKTLSQAKDVNLSKEHTDPMPIGTSSLVKDVNQPKPSHAVRMGPNLSNAGSLCDQIPITNYENSSSPKIVNKLESGRKQLNLTTLPKKLASKDSPDESKITDQVFSRTITEPTQEDLVAASESLIRLSMSHVPFKPNFFGQSSKANNQESINIPSSPSPATVHGKNYEHPMPPLKNTKSNTPVISSGKGSKCDLLKKCDNTVTVPSASGGESLFYNKSASSAKSSNKNILDTPYQLKNNLSSNSSKFVDASSSLGNNLQPPILEPTQKTSPSLNLIKKTKTDHEGYGPMSAPVLETNNLSRLDTNNTIIPDHKENKLQSKKVKNVDADAVGENSRKSKKTNLKHDISDVNEKIKSSNLTEPEVLSKVKAGTSERANSKNSIGEIKESSTVRPSEGNNRESQEKLKNNFAESKPDGKAETRLQGRLQSLSKQSNLSSKQDEGMDKKRSKSSDASSGSMFPMQRRSGRNREPSSPLRKSPSPSPPSQRVLRARKSTYFGEVDSSDEDEDFEFLIASGKFLNESEAGSSPKSGKDKSVNKEIIPADKKEEKKLVLSKRNNVAESRSNLRASNQDKSQESVPDSGSLKKIDNKNQYVDSAKSKLEKLEQASANKMNFNANPSQNDASGFKNTVISPDGKSKFPNDWNDNRGRSYPLAAALGTRPDGFLKNTNTLRQEASSSSSSASKTSYGLHQNEMFPAKTQNSVSSPMGASSSSQVQDSKSINNQITNFLYQTPVKPPKDHVDMMKNTSNNSVLSRNLNLTPNAVGTALNCPIKETSTPQTSANPSNAVKDTNIQVETENNSALVQQSCSSVSNLPPNKSPELPRIPNSDPSKIPNNPRTYFNRSLAAAHLKSHSAGMSGSKNVFMRATDEKQVNEILKPVNKDTESATVHPKKGADSNTPMSDLVKKSPSKEKDSLVISPAPEPVADASSASKEPTASASVNLSASWKNAFKNVKLPKPFASVPKTPMDRNAWIKKHSAPLRLNKPNEPPGFQSDPFLIKSKPNDVFSVNTLSTSSSMDNRKLINFDVRTGSTPGLSKPSAGSKDSSPQSLKKVEKNNPKFSPAHKNIKGSDLPLPLTGQLNEGTLPITNLSPTKCSERNSSAEKSISEPISIGRHSNLPPLIEQSSKHNPLKLSSPAKKLSSTVHERDVPAHENPGASSLTSRSKQSCDNARSQKEINSSKKDPIISSSSKGLSNTAFSPEESPIKVAPEKSSPHKKVSHPLSIENFIKPSTKTNHESVRKRSGSLLETGEEPAHKQMASEASSVGKSSSLKPVPALYDKMSVGADYFPEPQSQKPTYSSNPTLKKYSQSLSTSTRKSIDSEVDVNATASVLSSSSEGTPEKVTKKVIFQQRRMSTAKELESSKKAVAFSPEHESSVYAFEPDLPPTSTPFRRNKNKSNLDSSIDSNPETDSSSNNSIAVQVNLETEAVFECSTQAEAEEDDEEEGEEENKGQLFYIPLQQSVSAPSPQIQGVAVKLDTEGPDQRVIMRAKLVTKPPSNYAKKTAAVATNTVNSLAPLQVVSPEKRKVRPLGASSVDSSAPVGTVQPTSRSTLRDSPSPAASPKSAEHSTSSDLSLPSTSTASRSPKPAKRAKKSATQKTSTAKEFPKPESPGKIVEAPTFHPTEEEFSDPLEYIERIRPMAEQYGLCRVVPPSNFKPECKVADDMRFTAYNQFVHRMLHRWGPSSKESAAIRKHLATENITLKNPPCIGGVELDLPQLYQKVQICGGLKKVIEQDRWQRVADLMKIPKSVHDRSSKLDEIYCKYLLPYDTLSSGEKAKLFADVEKEWKHHKSVENELFEDIDDCIIKGRSMALNQFYRVARNIMTIHFGVAAADKEIGPDPEDVESQYWDYVSSGQNHICVHSASIDTGARGYGFPTTKNSTFAKHNWNLKILTNNSGSVLRSLGPLIGVTVPTLHVGMLFTTCCWYRDPHGLPWIEYLHTGARKIWYGIPAEYNSVFRSAMSKLLPSHKRSDQSVWLASDTAMVPPPLLVENGVSLSRVVQQPGQFIVVFPRAFTSSIATGYLLSESVYFAPSSWLQSANDIFIDLQNSCESSIFSLEQLLCSIATDSRTSLEILTQVAPLISEMRDREVALRTQLEDLGLRATERLPRNNKKRLQVDEDEDYECEICHANLFISLVSNSFEEVNYCLCHGIELLSKKRNHLKYCKLKYAYSEEELEEIIVKLNERIEMKSQKKLTHKSSGSTPTK
ncbi:unnamed protein product [Bemisia tabaci]|uniref:Uncharacterized protein n=1 Tax=Bemisia tabaci TaxID=7038 RepID=A0A9P0A956_BEMTA|nr:unnamed protein product [Bemisia tabaci]